MYSQEIGNKVLSNTTHTFNFAMMSSTCPFLVMRTTIIGTQSIDTIVVSVPVVSSTRPAFANAKESTCAGNETRRFGKTKTFVEWKARKIPVRFGKSPSYQINHRNHKA